MIFAGPLVMRTELMDDPDFRPAPNGSPFHGFLRDEPIFVIREWNDFAPSSPSHVTKAWRATPLG